MLHPIIKWAQRKDRIFIEIGLMDILQEKVQLTSTHLQFNGVSDKKQYNLKLQLFDQVNTEQSKWHKTGFHLLFVLIKKNTDAPFWPRIIKNKEKNQFITIDWSKWVEEDEEQKESGKGLGGFDPNQMQNFDMGGMGNAEGEEEGGNIDDLDQEQELEGESKEVK